jgi:hypothetical protein
VTPVPRWEHGYRCHGFWLGTFRVGCVSIGVRPWDGIYRWELDGGLTSKGEVRDLRTAKRQVEAALLDVALPSTSSNQPLLQAQAFLRQRAVGRLL